MSDLQLFILYKIASQSYLLENNLDLSGLHQSIHNNKVSYLDHRIDHHIDHINLNQEILLDRYSYFFVYFLHFAESSWTLWSNRLIINLFILSI